MPSNKPWLEGPSPQERAKWRAWQGGSVFVISAATTVGTHFGLGVVSIWTVIAAICGLFWMLVGLVTLLTGYE